MLLASILLPLSMLLLAPVLLQLFSSVVGLTVTGIHVLVLFNAVADTHAVAGVSSVVGSPVTGVHTLALVHALAGMFFF